MIYYYKIISLHIHKKKHGVVKIINHLKCIKKK